jgi:hypothetical protein
MHVPCLPLRMQPGHVKIRPLGYHGDDRIQGEKGWELSRCFPMKQAKARPRPIHKQVRRPMPLYVPTVVSVYKSIRSCVVDRFLVVN